MTVSERRQDAALRAYVQTGSVKGAAHVMGVTERAVRKCLAAYCDSHGFKSLVHAVAHFGTLQRGAERN